MPFEGDPVQPLHLFLEYFFWIEIQKGKKIYIHLFSGLAGSLICLVIDVTIQETQGQGFLAAVF